MQCSRRGFNRSQPMVHRSSGQLREATNGGVDSEKRNFASFSGLNECDVLAMRSPQFFSTSPGLTIDDFVVKCDRLPGATRPAGPSYPLFLHSEHLCLFHRDTAGTGLDFFTQRPFKFNTVTGDAQTIQTTNSVETAAGTMNEICTITLTPIIDESGNPAVLKGFSTATVASATASAASSAAASSDTASASVSASAAGGGGAISGFSTTVVGSASATTSAAASSVTAAASGGAISVNGFSSVSAGASGAATSGTAEAASASASASASAAAAESSQSTSAAFTLPGKQLSVLPIGLGVFAGISVIALIVVGLVTYERTKYRKAFRQRKLAESGAAMGYGGMA
ncbi:hypothetical protein CPB85DRAFT_720234 [Mucidula mucida]|nr:hypothetical protein CPB85DRAFT_720234 [Mucidula mucida]